MLLYTITKKGDANMPNIYDKIFHNIDYNTYKKLEKIFLTSGFGTILGKNLLLSDNPNLSTIASYFASLLLSSSLFLSYSNAYYYTSDIKEIKALYNKFLQNYKKLNQTFNFENPIQIHTLFNYLLYHGYLSQDQTFKFSSEQSRNIENLPGVNIFTGMGVCRHISPMFSDILTTIGIEAQNLGVTTGDYTISFEILPEPRHTKEELLSWCKENLIEEELYNFGLKLINILVDDQGENIELSQEFHENKKLLFKIFSNHAITFATQNGLSYYLDPTNKEILKLKGDSKNILHNPNFPSERIPISYASTFVLNSFKASLKALYNIGQKYPSLSLSDELEFL